MHSSCSIHRPRNSMNGTMLVNNKICGSYDPYRKIAYHCLQFSMVFSLMHSSSNGTSRQCHRYPTQPLLPTTFLLLVLHHNHRGQTYPCRAANLTTVLCTSSYSCTATASRALYNVSGSVSHAYSLAVSYVQQHALSGCLAHAQSLLDVELQQWKPTVLCCAVRGRCHPVNGWCAYSQLLAIVDM
jgi:hypothetical protein